MERKSFLTSVGSAVLVAAVAFGVTFAVVLTVVGIELSRDYGMRVDRGSVWSLLFTTPLIVGMLTLFVLRMREFERRHGVVEVGRQPLPEWCVSLWVIHSLCLFAAAVTHTENMTVWMAVFMISFASGFALKSIVVKCMNIAAYAILPAVGGYHLTGDLGGALWSGCAVLAAATTVWISLLTLRSWVLDRRASVQNADGMAAKTTIPLRPVEKTLARCFRSMRAAKQKKSVDQLMASYRDTVAKSEAAKAEKDEIITALIAVARDLAKHADDDKAHAHLQDVLKTLVAAGATVDQVDWDLKAPRAQA